MEGLQTISDPSLFSCIPEDHYSYALFISICPVSSTYLAMFLFTTSSLSSMLVIRFLVSFACLKCIWHENFFPGFWQFNMYDKLWDSYKMIIFFSLTAFLHAKLARFLNKNCLRRLGTRNKVMTSRYLIAWSVNKLIYTKTTRTSQIRRFPPCLIPRHPVIPRSVMNRATPLGVSIGSRVTVQIAKPELSMVLSSHMKMSRLRIVAKK